MTGGMYVETCAGQVQGVQVCHDELARTCVACVGKRISKFQGCVRGYRVIGYAHTCTCICVCEHVLRTNG